MESDFRLVESNDNDEFQVLEKWKVRKEKRKHGGSGSADKSPKKKRARTEDSDVDVSSDSVELDEIIAESKDVIKRRSDETNNPVEGTFYLEDLLPDDEVYTVQIPQGFNIKSVMNKNIDTEYINEIKDIETSKAYDLDFVKNDEKSLVLAVPSKKSEPKLVSLPVAGHVVIRRKLNIEAPRFETTIKCDISVPRGIKVRHPLLGPEWEKELTSVKITKQHGKRSLIL